MSISRKQIDETLALLCARFPNAFFMLERRRRPLKIGISRDIKAVLEGVVSHRQLHAAMSCYVGNVHYRKAQQAGVPRIALDGSESGTVSEADALSAAKAVARLEAKQEILHESAVASQPQATVAPPAPPPPKRDGLSALREAAAKRRQAATA